MNRLLLCPPDFYSIRYEINPWMNQQRDVDHEMAVRQWQQLYQALKSLGCAVELLLPEPDWPDMVFTANAGLVCGQRFFSSRFRHPERQGETPSYEAWFARQGYELVKMWGLYAFEGEGDALWSGGSLICGHGFRTDPEAHEWLAAVLRCPLISVELVNAHFYHLDTCFCPLGKGSVLWYPLAFSEASRRSLQEHVTDLMEVPAEEALCFACNAIVLPGHVLLPQGCSRTGELLKARGYEPHPLPMSEFIKAGGACKCLVLNLAATEDA